MSGSRRSIGPVRQLSLQQPAQRRQQIRRQRSAEDDKPLQIYTNPIARGKHGTNTKANHERPKVRIAWSEHNRKNNKEVEQVEVIARQIPGRSRPTTGRSLRTSNGYEKPAILYSRQELAERLRLAWKHREQNKANIDIFLAHGILEERCDSESSSHPPHTAPSTPLPQKEKHTGVEYHLNNDADILQEQQRRGSLPCTCSEEIEFKDEFQKKKTILLKNIRPHSLEANNNEEILVDTERHFDDVESSLQAGNIDNTGNADKEKIERDDESKKEEVSTDANSINENCTEIRKKLININYSNQQDNSTILPLIKSESTATCGSKIPKEDAFCAKQKRARFHSGTNRAFLGPIKPPMEFRCNSVTDEIISQKTTTDIKADLKAEKAPIIRVITETKDTLSSDKVASAGCNLITAKPTIQKSDSKVVIKVKFNAEKNAATKNVENKDSIGNNRVAATKNVNMKQAMEMHKVDQKPKRTSSAPPQRNLENLTSTNRVQVNIVIGANNIVGSTEKSSTDGRQECEGVEDKNTLLETTNVTQPKISCGRTIRSAPLKRRPKSSKKRFCGIGSCKNDEEGKSRNRSGNRGKNFMDCKPIDVVTMVSLISSADSDSDAENSPGDDKLINELRNKLPTNSIIKSTPNSSARNTRKPIKSVSFQSDTFDDDLSKEQHATVKEEKRIILARSTTVNNRENGGNLTSTEETLSWKVDTPGLALPILTLIHNAEETLDFPLTDREKRCLAVPIGDLHDKKRKLLRTRSTPSQLGTERQGMSMETKEQEPAGVFARNEISNQRNKTPVDDIFVKKLQAGQLSVIPSKEADPEIRTVLSEPHLQTNKEKECWHLYRKMCDKGVYVSFDTVLRGMLTPTEYRLRQKELSQDM